jgi:hypothetical protein
MSTREATRIQGSIDASYTARERSIADALTRLRVAGPDPDAKARARDALMLRLTAEQAEAKRPAAHSSMAC